MKSLSLAKPLVLVVIGLPGAGKSFFARQFSDTFGAPMVSGDRIRHILGVSNGRNPSGQQTVAQLISCQTEELFKTQKIFIIDGPGALKAERATLRKQAKDKGYDVLLVWVQTDGATAQYRSMKRSNRKEDDKYNPNLNGEDFAHLSRRFQTPLASEVSVVISGKHTYATQARIVLKKLVVPRVSEANARPIIGHEGRAAAPDLARAHNSPPARRNVLIR